MSNYIVNDIEATLSEVKCGAQQYGWQVKCDGRNPLANPSLFPAIDVDKIMTMVRLAYRRGCNYDCPLACSPHPLLQFKENTYAHLCMVVWNSITKARGEEL